MSTRISVRSFSFIAAEDQLRRLSVTTGEVASVGLGSMVAQPQSAPAAIPVWMDGTLSGAMAGRRPAASRPVQFRSTFPGGRGA